MRLEYDLAGSLMWLFCTFLKTHHLRWVQLCVKMPASSARSVCHFLAERYLK